MNVVVTGASGFIGRALTRELARRGAKPLALARSKPSSNDDWQQVEDYRELPSADVIVHLAEARDVGAGDEGARELRTANVSLAEWILHRGYDHIVYASSALVYGDRVPGERRPESEPDPVGGYALAKVAVEQVFGLHGATIARISNVYGKGMSQASVIADIVRQIPGAGPLVVRDDTSVRDFIWIEDVATALASMAMSDAHGTFNVASGQSHSIAHVAEMALRVAGESHRPVEAMRRAARVSRLDLNIDSTRERFNWQPRFSLETGLSHLMGYS